MDGEYIDRDTGEVIVAAPSGTHRWSSPCGELFAAMALAQADVANVEKAGDNLHFKSKYTKLGDVLDEVRPKFAKQGISITQMPINGAGSNIGIVTLFAHKSGQWIESTLYVAPTKFDAQGAGSVITYLRRYALMAMAGVAPDDDDGNAAVGSPSETPNAARTAQERPRGGYPLTQRPQAAPARSPGQEKAIARYKELAGVITRAEGVGELDEIDAALSKDLALMAALPEETTTLVNQLHDKIEGQKKYLYGATG